MSYFNFLSLIRRGFPNLMRMLYLSHERRGSSLLFGSKEKKSVTWRTFKSRYSWKVGRYFRIRRAKEKKKKSCVACIHVEPVWSFFFGSFRGSIPEVQRICSSLHVVFYSVIPFFLARQWRSLGTQKYKGFWNNKNANVLLKRQFGALKVV